MTMKSRLRHAGSAVGSSLYRISGGRITGAVNGLPVLLVTVAGRTSGVPHTTPVGYFTEGDDFVVTGSGGGSVAEPQWFQNLRHADRAVIEVGRRRMNVSVVVAGPTEHAVLWRKLVQQSPRFADYQQKVERQIPMATLSPVDGER
ncbi:nitroreductase/quinone reductase family protein [Glaciibacter sp. 2TAF33]|uniref:nitroreductase/quinone reductase family protein n=1 Tax=Glaciibacter sp. 2TAF33 TaxID=3233015 RepID=UPI003F929AC2